MSQPLIICPNLSPMVMEMQPLRFQSNADFLLLNFLSIISLSFQAPDINVLLNITFAMPTEFYKLSKPEFFALYYFIAPPHVLIKMEANYVKLIADSDRLERVTIQVTSPTTCHIRKHFIDSTCLHLSFSVF